MCEYKKAKNKDKKNKEKSARIILRIFYVGVFRRGNKPPVLPGDNKKLQQKKNLRDIIVNGLATALLEIYHGGF